MSKCIWVIRRSCYSMAQYYDTTIATGRFSIPTARNTCLFSYVCIRTTDNIATTLVLVLLLRPTPIFPLALCLGLGPLRSRNLGYERKGIEMSNLRHTTPLAEICVFPTHWSRQPRRVQEQPVSTLKHTTRCSNTARNFLA